MIGFAINMCCAIVNLTIYFIWGGSSALAFAGVSAFIAVGFLVMDLAS